MGQDLRQFRMAALTGGPRAAAQERPPNLSSRFCDTDFGVQAERRYQRSRRGVEREGGMERRKRGKKGEEEGGRGMGRMANAGRKH